MSSMQAHLFVFETKAQRNGFCFASPEVRRRERWLCRRRKSLNLLGAPKKLRFFGGGDPWESRTPVCGVRGRRLDHLTNGPIVASSLPAPNRAGKLTFPVTNLRLWESLLPKTNLRLFLFRARFPAPSKPNNVTSQAKPPAFFRKGQALGLLVSVS